MAFKTLTAFNEARKGQFFTLRDDGEFADVIFLYRSVQDVLIADTHYIKSDSYSGYVHCCGEDCPACKPGPGRENGLRVQTKLFIPLYNIGTGKIEFWDRDTSFEHHLTRQVFQNYSEPIDWVFRITRHGEYRSRETTYSIVAQGRNKALSYEAILSNAGVSLPDYYSAVCREFSAAELSAMLNNAAAPTQEYTNYGAVPRQDAMQIPEAIADPVTIPAPDFGTLDPAGLPPLEPIAEPEVAASEEWHQPDPDDSADDLGDVSF